MGDGDHEVRRLPLGGPRMNFCLMSPKGTSTTSTWVPEVLVKAWA